MGSQCKEARTGVMCPVGSKQLEASHPVTVGKLSATGSFPWLLFGCARQILLIVAQYPPPPVVATF